MVDFACSGMQPHGSYGVRAEGRVNGHCWRFDLEGNVFRLLIDNGAWYVHDSIPRYTMQRVELGQASSMVYRHDVLDHAVGWLDKALRKCSREEGWFKPCWTRDGLLHGVMAPSGKAAGRDVAASRLGPQRRPTMAEVDRADMMETAPWSKVRLAGFDVPPRDTASPMPTVQATNAKGAETMTTDTPGRTPGTKPAETTTSKAMAVLNQGVDEAKDAAWRGAAELAAEKTRDYLIGKLKKAETMPDVADVVARFLATAWGLALWSFILGCILPHVGAYVPKIGNKPQFARLARELRVEGFRGAFRGVATQIANIVSSALEVVGLLEEASAQVTNDAS